MRLTERLKDLFVPCEENQYTPSFLQRISVGIMLVLVLLSFAVANVQALLWLSSDWLVSTILPAVIVDLTNEERMDGSLSTLRRNDLLDRAATLKARDMAEKSYFAHYSPEGTSPWYWFDQVSYDFVNAGENLAVHFTDSQDVVDAWMNSPGHRANILNGEYLEIGVGTAEGEYKGFPTVFVVQLFATPKASEPIPVDSEVTTEPSQTSPRDTQNITLETVLESSPSDVLTEIAPATIETVSEGNEETVVTSTLDERAEATFTESATSEKFQVETGSDGGVVMYTNLATTSRPGVPAVIDATGGDHSESETSLMARTATQPGLWLQFVYGMLAFIVAIALILSIVIEWRRQNPVQIAYGAGLLALMLLLLHMHIALTSGVTIV